MTASLRSGATHGRSDAAPGDHEILEVHIGELRQLFNAIDPAPLPGRDLDPRIEEFIVDWGRELARLTTPSLHVRLDRAEESADVAALVADTVHGFFTAREASARRRLKRLFHDGRTSLAIGFAAVLLFTIAAQFVGSAPGASGFSRVLHESLSIGGWVAMWRPLEIFLYDWWPIRATARLYARLAAMPVRVTVGPP